MVGLSAFMGTALTGINSLRSRQTWFAQLEAAARRATSAKCGEMAHAPTRVEPALFIYPNRSKAVEESV